MQAHWSQSIDSETMSLAASLSRADRNAALPAPYLALFSIQPLPPDPDRPKTEELERCVVFF